MDKRKSIILGIGGAAATISFALNIFYDLIPISNGLVKIFTLLLMDVLSYAIIYFLIEKIAHWFWKKLHKNIYVDGIWHHVHLMESDTNYLKKGSIKIKQNFYDLKISGFNRSVKDFNIEEPVGQRTNWKENVCLLCEGEKIIGRYTAQTYINDKIEIREGIHTFYLDKSKDSPTFIEGSFQEVSPHSRTGEIKLFKNKKDMDSFIKNIKKHLLIKSR
ncbi:MAG: hypothetical protein LBR74_08585 [Eubacterium sp.]|jgi:hypothetical protein|nr:hypothetical protein [Eubacterium sp.]